MSILRTPRTIRRSAVLLAGLLVVVPVMQAAIGTCPRGGNLRPVEANRTEGVEESVTGCMLGQAVGLSEAVHADRVGARDLAPRQFEGEGASFVGYGVLSRGERTHTALRTGRLFVRAFHEHVRSVVLQI